MPLTPPLCRIAEQAEGADQEFRALRDVVLHEKAWDFSRHINTATLPQHHQPARGEQECRARGEKAVDDVDAALRAAELREQQRNDQQLVKAFESGEAFAPRHIRPEHSDHRNEPEQRRQAAGRRLQFSPHRYDVERRDQRDQPRDSQHLRDRDRPRQGDGDADREPVRYARKARTIEGKQGCDCRVRHLNLAGAAPRSGGCAPAQCSRAWPAARTNRCSRSRAYPRS